MGAIMIGSTAARLTIVASLTAVGLWWGIAVHSAGRPDAASGSPVTNATASPTSPAMNTLSSDGGVSLSVAGVNCDHKSPMGEYCYVTFHAVNVSDGIPLFNEADQVAYDLSGGAFHPDQAASAVANGGKPITQRLQHGAVTGGVLAFALPAGDRIDHVVLHGKSGTPGEIFAVPR
jgi:hypothetical protein